LDIKKNKIRRLFLEGSYRFPPIDTLAHQFDFGLGCKQLAQTLPR
jgi:hypothetical protein